ncbi:(4Fe-4S)-binding protein, partial [Mycobacterium sp. ITM-2017-0098]
MDKLPTRLAEHPTVRAVRSRPAAQAGVIDADWLRAVCLDAG